MHWAKRGQYIWYISFGAYLKLYYRYVIYIKIYGMLPLGEKKSLRNHLALFLYFINICEETEASL